MQFIEFIVIFVRDLIEAGLETNISLEFVTSQKEILDNSNFTQQIKRLFDTLSIKFTNDLN